jgi:hypothetical protein
MTQTRPSIISRLHPAVPRRYLFVLAGALWMAAGALLCVRAAIWLDTFPFSAELALEALSIASAAGAYSLLFSRIVQKNIDRITRLPDPVCIFAFTAWRGYIMIALMMAIGITLRGTPIPKYYLSVPYTMMGAILLIGSVSFYRRFVNALIRK